MLHHKLVESELDAKRLEKQATASNLSQRKAATMEAVRAADAESLHIIALTWLWRSQLLSNMAAGLDGNESHFVWRFGRAAYAPKVMVDFFFQQKQIMVRTEGSDAMERTNAGLAALEWMNSALEHAVLEELVSEETSATSTTRLVSERACSNRVDAPLWVLGGELLDLRTDAALASSYDYLQEMVFPGETNMLLSSAAFAGDPRLLVATPEFQPGIDEFAGLAFCAAYKVAMLISGGGFHGYGGFTIIGGNLVNSFTGKPFMENTAFGLTINPAQGDVNSISMLIHQDGLNFLSNDPIDMRSGAYLYSATDAEIRCRPALAFRRNYSSIQATKDDAFFGQGVPSNGCRRKSGI